MQSDPAASYRSFTPRQRAQAQARFDREARHVLGDYARERRLRSMRANLAGARRALAAAESALQRGTLKGQPLTLDDRRILREIVRDKTRLIDRITGDAQFRRAEEEARP